MKSSPAKSQSSTALEPRIVHPDRADRLWPFGSDRRLTAVPKAGVACVETGARTAAGDRPASRT